MARWFLVSALIPSALIATFGACAPQDLSTPMFEPESEALFDAPFPSNTLLGANGTPDMSGYPNPGGLALLDELLDLAQTQRGFGATSPIYLRFKQPIDPDTLPSPSQTLDADSSVRLVDVDPNSPELGRLFPLVVEWTEHATTYQPSNLLALAPVLGVPLRPDTTYALVLTRDFAAPAPGFKKVWSDDHPDHAVYAPLLDQLSAMGLHKADVAIATVFTTGRPLDEMAAIATHIRSDLGPGAIEPELVELDRNGYYIVYETTYPSPVYQHGIRPYSISGGGFVFDQDGVPDVHSWDVMRMSVTTPLNLDDAPEAGWPVIIYAHGTGGDYRTFSNGDTGIEVASMFAKAGFVGVGFDQPLHGTRRPGDPDAPAGYLDSFNFLNPEAAQTNFRQGAIDVLYLAHTLAADRTDLDIPGGQSLPIDGSKVYYLGHSHGGLTGALALPFLGDDVRAAVLSGAGGGISTTLIVRKDPVDIAALIAITAGFAEDETLSLLHPLTGLLQQVVEVTDPLTYAPFWLQHTADVDFARPVPVLMTSGLFDEQTDHLTSEALAAAAGLPIIEPAANTPLAHELLGLQPASEPAAGLVDTWDGGHITAGLTQWPDGNHFVIFKDSAAATTYQSFFASARDGEAVIDTGR